jgi:hypothetical protein
MQSIWYYDYLPTTDFQIGASLTVGDINMDGVSDLLACLPGLGVFDIYYGQSGTKALNFIGNNNCGNGNVPNFCNTIANVGEFDNANGNDVVVSAVNARTLVTMTNTGAGLGTTCVSYLNIDIVQYLRGLSDINGDNIADFGFLTANANGNIGFIEPGNTNGDFAGRAIPITAPSSYFFKADREIVGLGKFSTDNLNDFALAMRGNDYKYAYVFYGSTSITTGSSLAVTSPAFVIQSALDLNGKFVICRTNINGDNYQDLAIIDTTANGGFIFLGGITRSGTVPIGNANIKITTSGTYSNCFRDIDGNGDYNNDGYKDIILGCEPGNGASLIMGIVVYGSSSLSSNNIENLIAQGKAYALIFSNNLNPSFINLTPVLVDISGDFNNDGFSDVVVSYSKAYRGSVQVGSIFVYYGDTTSNLATSPSPTPSVSPSPTPSITPSHTPSISVTPSASPSHVPDAQEKALSFLKENGGKIFGSIISVLVGGGAAIACKITWKNPNSICRVIVTKLLALTCQITCCNCILGGSSLDVHSSTTQKVNNWVSGRDSLVPGSGAGVGSSHAQPNPLIEMTSAGGAAAISGTAPKIA